MVRLLIAATIVACSGCYTNRSFIKAVDGYTRAILPEYRNYVQNDSNLDSDSKRIRIQTAEQFQKLVNQADSTAGD